MTPLAVLEEPQAPAEARPGFALWQLGFRPFYLLAGVFSVLSIGLWAAQFSGWLTHPYLAGPLWHAHEMLFGYALAVVVGFLFTAGRNWSNQPTPTGLRLAALALLWIAGRILVLTPWGLVATVVDVAFPLAAAAALAVPFWRARLRRNYFFVGLLLLMAVANLLFHLTQLGVLNLPPFLGLQVALDALLFIVAVMAGRVVPMFTNNGVPGAGAKRLPRVEQAALGALLLLLAGDLLRLPGGAVAAVAFAAAIAHLLRLLLWRPWKTLRTPLVWVLHAAYAWLPLHLALRAAASLGWVTQSSATHALTVGTIGAITLGMMTRTARGHTARPLLADRYDTVCYALVLLAALVRVGLPMARPDLTVHAVVCSAVLWVVAFGVFVCRYAPILVRPRLDGKPG